jgi:uncharacterized protein YbbC (DUF1343 family)
MLLKSKILLLFFLTASLNCKEKKEIVAQNMKVEKVAVLKDNIIKEVLPGAYKTENYFELIKDRKVALVVNQTSMIGEVHLVDSLKSLGVATIKIFAPEHGFRGDADAGEAIKDGIDNKTGIPIISLYGKKKKPSKEDLEGIEIIVFDIQDVGARFYTYISAMTYIMEACAGNNIDFMVLDRPNPNGHYVDGPVLKDQVSFVGLHPVPVVHGMTIGEYAKMVNGEGWLKDGLQCNLNVIKCENYDHNIFYNLPVKPSPNLPNMRSIYLYPSICFFEGTTVSEGRGTNKQFQVYGHPKYIGGDFSFTPKSMIGAKYPKHENELCYGYDLTGISIEDIRSERKLNLDYLINFYNSFPKEETFFLENNFFDKLAGSNNLRNKILNGISTEEIRESWQKDLEKFNKIRKKYLLYKDFN